MPCLYVGLTVTFLSPPVNIRWAYSGSAIASDNAVAGLPSDAVAVIASITTFDSDRFDHVIHTYVTRIQITTTCCNVVMCLVQVWA